MKVCWNPQETIQVDLAEGPDDYVLELNRADGAQVTVKSTQFSASGELFIKVNGRSAGTMKPEILLVDNYAIRIFSYEDDHIPIHEIAILSHEIKGKSLRLRVDVCP